ncbi:hypothetical protein HMPREF9056_00950 [Actinomyces sp. oral taxon 170 str. F0386]|nr:hypothetical protein HMPREF9056_00950 [Actinomyces sp. oral taxon 170 str. F0386]
MSTPVPAQEHSGFPAKYLGFKMSHCQRHIPVATPVTYVSSVPIPRLDHLSDSTTDAPSTTP